MCRRWCSLVTRTFNDNIENILAEHQSTRTLPSHTKMATNREIWLTNRKSVSCIVCPLPTETTQQQTILNKYTTFMGGKYLNICRLLRIRPILHSFQISHLLSQIIFSIFAVLFVDTDFSQNICLYLWIFPFNEHPSYSMFSFHRVGCWSVKKKNSCQYFQMNPTADLTVKWTNHYADAAPVIYL